jgi:cardiolipin synthase
MKPARLAHPGVVVRPRVWRRRVALWQFAQQPWWVLLFFGLGVIATVTVLWGLFTATSRPPALHASALPRVTSAEFLDALAGAVPTVVQAGGTAQLLHDGDEFYPALLETIRGARRSVTFLAYIWEDGAISDTLLDALVDRVRHDVSVYVLLDAFGAARAPRARFQALEAAGAHVAYYRPARFGMLTRYHRRNHRRAIVVDGQIGFTGGAAVSDKWQGRARTPDEWRDSMLRVTGPLARTLQGAFAQSWASAAGEVLAGPAFFAAPSGPPSTLRHIGVASSPTADGHSLRTVFWLSFAAARERLYVSSSYFVPDEVLRGAIADRARAGVDVRLLLPGQHTDAKPIRWVSHHYYDELLSAGVRVYEYQPTFMHAKLVVADGAWTVVGSANMDVRSEELNEENVIGVQDPALARAAEARFLADLARAEEIRLTEWRRRGVWPWLLEHVAALFAEQL